MSDNIKDISIGAMIQFRSKNPNDITAWRGTLESVGGYRSIQSRTNPAPYHQAVRQVDPSVPLSEVDLTYFLITVDNSASQPTMQVFAQEWIEPGSLLEINLGTKVTIEVTDSVGDSQAILSLLASGGYATKIIPNR